MFKSHNLLNSIRYTFSSRHPLMTIKYHHNMRIKYWSLPHSKLVDVKYRSALILFLVLYSLLYHYTKWNSTVITQTKTIVKDREMLQLRKRAFEGVIMGRSMSQCSKRSIF